MSDEWTPSEGNVPIDPGLEGKLVRSIEAMSAMWQTISPENDEKLPCPVLIITFYHRDGTSSPVVLTMAGVASMNTDVAEHISALWGGVEPISSTVLDEGLQAMLDEAVNNNNEGDSHD